MREGGRFTVGGARALETATLAARAQLAILECAFYTDGSSPLRARSCAQNTPLPPAAAAAADCTTTTFFPPPY